MLLVANLANTKWWWKLEKSLKSWHMGTYLMSIQQTLSNEYQHDRVETIFKNLCFLVFSTNVALALEGLKVINHIQCYLKYYRKRGGSTKKEHYFLWNISHKLLYSLKYFSHEIRSWVCARCEKYDLGRSDHLLIFLNNIFWYLCTTYHNLLIKRRIFILTQGADIV